MTGVIKSSRCGTCRRRKVKCDEVKPVCGPCRKKNRICEEPVSRYKFARETPLCPASATLPTKESMPSFKPQKITTIRSIPATDGAGSFQTMRLIEPQRRRRGNQIREEKAIISTSPSMSATESLQQILCHSFQTHVEGWSIKALATFVTEIPVRLGHSEALDNAVACIVNCHSSLCSKKLPYEDPIQAKLYMKSLVSLQKALNDPVEGYTDETLAAVTIIGQIEMFGGGSQGGTRWISHAGGAARLLQVRGPGYCKSRFSKILLSLQRQNCIMVSISRNEDCFLAESPWQRISFEELYTEELHPFVIKFTSSLLVLPSIIKQVRLFHYRPDMVDPTSIYLKLSRLRHSFAEVFDYINTKLNDGTTITELPTQTDDSLTPFVYHFTSNPLASLCAAYWCFQIIVDTLMARFLPFRPLATDVGCETASSTLSLEELCDSCIQAREHIIKSYEFSEQRQPFDVVYLAAPIIFAYHGATVTEREWLIERLWRVGELMPNSRKVWSEKGLKFIYKCFLGEPMEMI